MAVNFGVVRELNFDITPDDVIADATYSTYAAAGVATYTVLSSDKHVIVTSTNLGLITLGAGQFAGQTVLFTRDPASTTSLIFGGIYGVATATLAGDGSTVGVTWDAATSAWQVSSVGVGVTIS